MPRALRNAVNFVAMQAGWFACVLSAAHDAAAIAPVFALLVVALHLLLSVHRRDELRLAGSALLIGVLWESLATATGFIRYNAGTASVPFWIFMMWPMFATTLNVSMRFLQRRWVLAAALGAIGAPLSYLAGERLGALVMPERVAAIALQAAGWAVLMPLLIHLAPRISREWRH